MKKLFSRLPKKVLVGVAIAAALAGSTGVVKAWYPDRPTFTMQSPAPYVTFDSITDNPSYGDERTFFDAKSAAITTAGGYADSVNVTNGEEVVLRMYVHNDAATNLNGANLDGTGVAHGATARVALPTATDTALRANAYINASNANPGTVSDTVNFAGSNAFQVEYVPGSAEMSTNAVPAGFKLSDNIVTTGAPIGYTGANGTIPGCLQYSGIITMKVKIKTAGFSFNKQVANPGQPWAKSVTANPGSQVSYELAFANTGSTQLTNVVLRDQLPQGVSIVPGSSKLFNTSSPNGVALGTDAVTSNGGVVIGTYNPGSNAFLTFKATVPTADKLHCGDNTFTNIGEARTSTQAIDSTAVVTVAKTCVTPTPTPNAPVYSCDLLNVSQGDNRSVTVNDFKFTTQNGATFKDVVLNWGDNTTPLTTNTVVGQKHTYAANGTYAITAVAHFTVNGQDVTAAGASCAKQVTFGTPTTPATPTTPTTPTALVNTGAGDTFGIFAAAAVAGAVVYRMFLGRRLSRES